MNDQGHNQGPTVRKFVPVGTNHNRNTEPLSRGERLLAIARGTKRDVENDEANIKAINFTINYPDSSNDFLLQKLYKMDGAYPYVATLLNACNGSKNKALYISKGLIVALSNRDPNRDKKVETITDYEYRGIFKITGSMGLATFTKSGPKGMKVELTAEWNKGC